MQLVRPKVVAMAVRMEIIMLMISFQVSFLFSVDIIIKVLGQASPPCPLSKGEGSRMLCGWVDCRVNVMDKWFLEASHSPLPRRGVGGEAEGLGGEAFLRVDRFSVRVGRGLGLSPSLVLNCIRTGIVGVCSRDLCGSGEHSAGEITGGTGPEMHRLDVLRGREHVGVVGGSGGEAGGEDGEVGDLHRVALEDELADAVHHVGQHTEDSTLGVRGVVVGHVLGELLEVDGLVDGGTGEPLAVGLVALGLVLIDFVV